MYGFIHSGTGGSSSEPILVAPTGRELDHRHFYMTEGVAALHGRKSFRRLGRLRGARQRNQKMSGSSDARVAYHCIRHLLTCMLPTKIDPCDLQKGAPELGNAELAEHRILVRTFPKDAQERDCYRYLLQAMQASPLHPPETKADFEDRCRARFRITKDSFNYCWREASRVTGARWDRPGRRPR